MSEHLGMDVMLSMLGGNAKSVEAFKNGLNRKIKSVQLRDDELHFEFVDGYKMRLSDEGQLCCEDRYMRTDDDLTRFAGSVLLGAEIREAPNVADKDGEHEVQFLAVKTSVGEFVMSSHNEHDGEYGGFSIRASEVKP